MKRGMFGAVLIVCLLITKVVLANASVEEEWAVRHAKLGEESGVALGLDVGGNIYVAGFFRSPTDGEIFKIIKYDTTGNELWSTKHLGILIPNNLYEKCNGFVVDGDGNSYATYIDRDSAEMGTAKFNSEGKLSWKQEYGGGSGMGTAIAVDGGGNVYAAGTTATVKYDSEGNELWAEEYLKPGAYSCQASAVAVDILGNVYVTGRWSGGGDGMFVVKFDNDGDLQWENYIDGKGYEVASKAISVDSQGNVYVVGQGPIITGGYGEYAVWKYDSSGKFLWKSGYDGDHGNENAYAIAFDGANSIYITGQSAIGCSPGSDPGGCYGEMTTVKFNKDGKRQWVARSGVKDSQGMDIVVGPEGDVYVTGYIWSPGRPEQGLTAKISSEGKVLWQERYTSLKWSAFSAIGLDSSANIFVTGHTRKETSLEDPDFLTVKYSQTPELPKVTITAVSSEASEGGSKGRFKISRTGDTSTSLRVRYRISGTATNGVDYKRILRWKTIKAGISSCIVYVNPIDDSEVERKEGVVLTIVAQDTYELDLPMSAKIVISDNDQ